MSPRAPRPFAGPSTPAVPPSLGAAAAPTMRQRPLLLATVAVAAGAVFVWATAKHCQGPCPLDKFCVEDADSTALPMTMAAVNAEETSEQEVHPQTLEPSEGSRWGTRAGEEKEEQEEEVVLWASHPLGRRAQVQDMVSQHASRLHP